MLICLCNALKDSQFRCARQEGACSVAQMFKSLGCQPQCGKCVPYLREALVENNSAQAAF